MEASEFEQEHEAQPDQSDQATEPSSESSPGATPESAPEAAPSSEPSPESAPEPEAPAEEPSEPAAAEGEPEPEAEGGLLAGTGSEQEPGVGGTGDHPAPAMMRGEDGELHSAGQPPSGTGEHEQSPVGDATDVTDAEHALSPEAREELEQVHEPDQVGTERPDLGTE